GSPGTRWVALCVVRVAWAALGVPRTSVLGAILLTAYLGGATATHVRIGEPFFMPILLGVLVWGGLFLRDERLRALLPLRQKLMHRRHSRELQRRLEESRMSHTV